MLSICIPVYNVDARDLIQTLHDLGLEQESFEIIVLDDASDFSFQKLNREVQALPHVLYKELTKNTGRSAIRNLFLKYAKYNYLLFIDGDAKVMRNDFLKKYFNYKQKADVICGGTAYENSLPESKYILRWTYGQQREAIPAEQRQQFPNRSFSGFNFLIKKNIFNKIRFDESITQYGHEDTLLGHALQKANIPVFHIDNPLIHLGLDESNIFLEKTEASIENLVYIQRKLKTDQAFTHQNKLLLTVARLEKTGLEGLVYFILKNIKNLLHKNLCSSNPNIRYFDLYKLFLFLRIKRSISRDSSI